MKRLVIGIVVLIIGVVIAFNSIGLTMEENKIEETVIKENVIEENENINGTYIKDLLYRKEEFIDAYTKGIKIDYSSYFYDGTVYGAYNGLELSEKYRNIEGKPFNRNNLKFYENYFCEMLRNDYGWIHPYVEIRLAGFKNNNNYDANSNIYIMEFGAIQDLNEFSNPELGNFYIGENMHYNRIVCAFTAPQI